MQRSLTIFLLSFLLLPMRMTAQTETQPADSALNRLLYYMKHAMMFNRATPQEKAYLHFDNTGYFKGETMRFKAYVVRADRNLPTDISRVLYVELLNASGDVIDTRKLRLEHGMAEGDFQTDSIFGTGFYEVRAFTRYMMNWGGVGAFSRVFPIFYAPDKEGDYSQPRMEELTYNRRLPERQGADHAATDAGHTVADGSRSVTFYPEGGDMVVGLPCRVAFRAVKDGRRTPVKALLLDAADNILEMVETDADGVGAFDVTPDGKALRLVVTDEQQKRSEYTLPTARAEGCVLRVSTDDDIVARLYASPSMQGRLLGYTLMHNGNVMTADTLVAQPAVEFEFERSKMLPGVNQLTVFDSDGRIQAERLFFICPPTDAADSIRVSEPAYGMKPCGRIRMDIAAPAGSDLSFSAMDAATLTNGKVGNLRTWMLLSSEVRGYIENPDYYFEADDAVHRRAADLLMLTQGWRRYDWRLHSGVSGFDVLEGYTGRLQPIEDKLYVFGRLKPDTNRWRKKHPVAGVDLSAYLYNKNGEHMRGDCITDSVGGYAFEMPDVTGEWNLQIKTRYDGKDARYVVAIDRHFSPAVRPLSPLETDMIPLPSAVEVLRKQQVDADAEGEGSGIARKNGTYILPTVKVKGRYFTDNSRLPWYDEKTGARKSTIYYNVDEASDAIIDSGEQLPTLYEWLKQKNPFFEGTNSLDDRWVVIDDTTGKMLSVNDPGVSVDLMTDYLHTVYKDGLTYKKRPILWIVNNAYNTITYYPYNTYSFEYTNGGGVTPMPDFLDEVKSVYVSEDEDNYTHFVRSDDVVRIHPVTVYVYTHPQFTTPSKGLRRTHFQGYNVPTEFVMEDYSQLPPMADYRRTIFWAPAVHVDETGHATVEFFNNSSCSQLYISAEGITPQGHFVVSE